MSTEGSSKYHAAWPCSVTRISTSESRFAPFLRAVIVAGRLKALTSSLREATSAVLKFNAEGYLLTCRNIAP